MKILIIQTAFIGDVILATALIEKLAIAQQGSQIDVLVRKGNEVLLANNPHINRVIVFDKKNNKYGNLIKVIREIRKERYDQVINVQRFFTTGLITTFSRAKEKTGFDKNPLSRFFDRKIIHKMKMQEGNYHETDRNQELIEHLSDRSAAKPKMYPSQDDYSKVMQASDYVTLAPASVWFTKQYPKEKWIELISAITHNVKVILIGGPSDHTLCAEICSKATHPNIENLSGNLSFTESAALMQRAKMNYVNDSAPLHIASAVNAPVTAIFCSTIPNFGFTPLSDVSHIIEYDEVLQCRPCGIHGDKSCHQKHFKCSQIAVNRIIETSGVND